MKAILEFDLPEDHDEFSYASNAPMLVMTLHEFDQELRKMYKHEDKETIEISKVRELLRDILYQNLDIEVL